MLGKLFSLGASPGGQASAAQSSTTAVSSLESVHEDEHTRHLLFPDPQDLFDHRQDEVFPLVTSLSPGGTPSTAAFDYHAEIDLEARDVRVIIMQDAMSSMTASLLYDSQSPPPPPTSPTDRPTTATPAHLSRQESRRNPTSPRKPSIGQMQRPVVVQTDTPGLRQGTFDRRPSVQSRQQHHVESDAQRTWREYREELATFSSCIFGNSELMAYKGTSTKVHLVPTEARQPEHGNFGDGRGSLGRSSLRSSRLSQSFSSENPPLQAPPTPGFAPRSSEKRKVLITRLFPVVLPTDEDPAVTPVNRYSEAHTSFPFPHAADDVKAKKRKPQVKQKRTPMYAVALIVTLPQASAPPSMSGSGRHLFRGSSSFNEQEFLSSSYGSAKQSPWAVIGTGGFQDMEQSITSDVDDPLEVITQHWDIIMRTLSRLQAVATATICMMLKQADYSSPNPFANSVPSASAHVARKPSLSGRRSEDGLAYKPPKTNAKLVALQAHALYENRQIHTEVDMARNRIVAGLRAHRVVTGQNRWPIWREEARWMAKRVGGKDQGFFFAKLLTGFLAVHTEWLQALGPPSYRRRYIAQQKDKSHEDTPVPSRTIIVAQDKMVARRLIFLLAAFLPASQQYGAARAHRPSTAASLGGAFSQSPPSFVVPLLKEESLRRKINRRGGPRRASHSRNLSQQSSQQSQTTRTGLVPGHLAHLSMDSRHERRQSDTASIRTTHLPIPVISGSEAVSKQSSGATTATITTETSAPHFSTGHRPGPFGHYRIGSNSSMATDDLKRLAMEDSRGSEPRQGSRWNVISTLWNPRRRNSAANNLMVPPPPAEASNNLESSTRAVKVNVTDNNSSHTIIAPSLAESPKGGLIDTSGYGQERPREAAIPHAQGTPPQVQINASLKAQPTAGPTGAYESPVKTSINLDDGVIDVDVPFPDYITAPFDTAVSSPSSSGYLSMPGAGNALDSFEQVCRTSADTDSPANVAGWLQHHHPDFVLQAVPSQNNLIDQVKASMRAEPSPVLWAPASVDPAQVITEKWVDMSTALVADVTTYTITRLRYRRLVRVCPATDRGYSLLSGSVGSYNSTSTALLTPGLPSAISPLGPQEDEFLEEPIVVLDELLTAAVERVIATGGPGLAPESAAGDASNRSSRHRRVSEARELRGRSNSASTGTGSDELRNGGASPAEVPRSQCKKVVLSALEDIVQSVVEQRDREQAGHVGHHGREKENVLRGAVREWLDIVDASE